MYSGAWNHLELQAMQVHDLVLAKIERNSARERYDVMSLAQAGLLDTEILRRRHHEEVRPYLLSHQESRDLTLNLWIESLPGEEYRSRPLMKMAMCGSKNRNLEAAQMQGSADEVKPNPIPCIKGQGEITG